MVLALVVAGALLLAGLVALLLLLGQRTGTATEPPTGLGDDPVLDRLAQECFDGDMQACDHLYRNSPRGSDYQIYGGTCAGRQPEARARTVYCTDAFPDA